MFSSISWQQYFLFLLIAVVAYYLFTWVIYFKAERSPFFRRGQSQSLENEEGFSTDIQSNSQKIIEEIKPAFAGRQNRNELIYALHTILKKYNRWDEPDFREEVNGFILSESKTKCSIHLNEEDMNAVWLD